MLNRVAKKHGILKKKTGIWQFSQKKTEKPGVSNKITKKSGKALNFKVFLHVK